MTGRSLSLEALRYRGRYSGHARTFLVALAGLSVLALLARGLDAQQPAPRRPDVIFVPTPPEVVDAMLKLANVTAKDTVFDLGCGDGIIVATAAQKFGAQAVGIDIDPQRVKEANERVQKAGVTDKVKILNEDLFEANISPATVVTLYLLPSLNQKLIPKLNKDLKPGTRIVSQSFDMGDEYPPEKTVDVNGRMVYLWTVPMKKKQ